MVKNSNTREDKHRQSEDMFILVSILREASVSLRLGPTGSGEILKIHDRVRF